MLKNAMKKIPNDMEKLMVVRIHKINTSIAPGLYMHDWYSSRFDGWVDACEGEIHGLEKVLQKAQNVLDFRIEPTLHSMASCKFTRFPEQPDKYPYEVTTRGNPMTPASLLAMSPAAIYVQSKREIGTGWTLSELVKTAVTQANNTSSLLQELSQSVYDATEEYVNIILEDFDDFVEKFVANYNKDDEDKSSGPKSGESNETVIII